MLVKELLKYSNKSLKTLYRVYHTLLKYSNRTFINYEGGVFINFRQLLTIYQKQLYRAVFIQILKYSNSTSANLI